ncbi:MAG: hypothetical protein OXG37_14140 [Actinomycetia bacterium]|nr:hypothetical protein [Actinomycetes bacterium]
MYKHWRRDRPQFFNVHALDWERGPETPSLSGLEARLLSRPVDGVGASYMVRIPPGWSRTATADDGAIDVFVLEGDLSIEGSQVGAGGYAFLPRDGGGAELGSKAGAQAFLFWNPEPPDGYGSEVQIRKVWQEPWKQMDMPGAIHGAMYKPLRLPDIGEGAVHGGPGGGVRLYMFTPGFSDPREHVHTVWEEMIYLTGDMFMPDRGVLAHGSYMGNPADFWHAPMLSARGAVLLFHNTAPIDVELREYPGGEAVAGRYRDEASWLETPTQEEWSDLAHYHTAPDRVEAWQTP